MENRRFPERPSGYTVDVAETDYARLRACANDTETASVTTAVRTAYGITKHIHTWTECDERILRILEQEKIRAAGQAVGLLHRINMDCSDEELVELPGFKITQGFSTVSKVMRYSVGVYTQRYVEFGARGVITIPRTDLSDITAIT
ncbi:hypothetical protein HYS00_02915 [Candidatus Microgenomates bacterium]|nr:hypothetical protein [Candidatus Microgenomates bacterium]